MEQAHKIIEGIHYATGRVVRLGIEYGIIHSMAEVDGRFDSGEGARLPLVAPGLVDLQVNGYMGVDFNTSDLSVSAFREVLPVLAARGITSFYPTLVTGSPDRISAALASISGVMNQQDDLSKLVGGIHLEGPFISPEDGPRGAHSINYCRRPDTELVKRWQDETGGKIRIITLAPELPGSTALIRVCRELGMLVAIGHTAATADDIQRAVDAGASLSTHLGNGAHAMLPRHPNYIWEQLAEDRLYASMIADGFHLSDSVLKVFSRTKGEKGILVSDSMCFGGMKPGEYESPATGKIHLSPEGKLHIAGNPKLLAGSASSLLEGIVHMARLTGFATAWEMGSLHPARLMNAQRPRGLKVGAPADLVLLEGGESDSHGDIGANMNGDSHGDIGANMNGDSRGDIGVNMNGDSNLNRAKVIEVYKNGTPIYKRP